jgi:hypothetical protein
MFWRRKAKEPEFTGIGEEKLRQKVEHTLAHMIADELKVVLSNLKIEIPPVKVDHEVTGIPTSLDLNIPDIKITGIPAPAGNTQPPVKPDVAESIRERKAAQAERINEILKTKGEKIRSLRYQYWNMHLEADRKGLKKEAAYYKVKVEALDEVIGGNDARG